MRYFRRNIYNGMVLKNENGYPELIVMAACDIAIYHATSNWLREKLNLDFHSKNTDNDKSFSEFTFAETEMVLSYDRNSGIVISPKAKVTASAKERAAFEQLLGTLKSH